MKSPIIARIFEGGGGLNSKPGKTFTPFSHCGKPVILRVINPENLKSLLCNYKNEAFVNKLNCFTVACNDAKRYAEGEPVILVYVT